MDKAARLRWLILMVLLASTVGAILYPVDEAPAVVEASARTVAVSRAAKPAAAPVEPSREWLAADDNPFAPRGWLAPAPVIPVETRTVAPVVVNEPAPPPPPQPLPFRYLGQMSDKEDRVIYLGLGEELLPARLGDVLDGRYKVVALSAAKIEFETINSGLRQSLPLPAQDR